MSLEFKLWARVEVYDTEKDEHEDINPSICEYAMHQCDSLEGMAEFIETNALQVDENVKEQMEEACKIQNIPV